MTSPKSAAVLYVSYPMLPVTDASCGGAEQILWTLEREIHSRGWRTTVAACKDSRVNGELFSTGLAPLGTDRFQPREAEHSSRIVEMLRRSNGDFSLVHDMSGQFFAHAAHAPKPMLVTLHLPRSFYSESLFRALPPNVYFNCVSESQAASFSDLPRMLGVVPNGIALDRFPLTHRKADYLLWLGRICPEKGAHLAIEVAQRAGLPLVIAGQVYPFSYHQQYFQREIKPHIERADSNVTYIEAPSFDDKVKLLANARAVIVSTLAQETSSLVAMEAMACGTPVVAFRKGALPEVVQHGVTGYIANSLDQMIAAVNDLDHIWPEACRHHVEENFCSRRMASDYEAMYEAVNSASQTVPLVA